ncbi:hypothetical protein M427DRAFT_156016 [Gonapodya prolifera JEL478]|uniref:Uncharacterized protein n=1 Tax=Gonapodya prolifera (strain JEL478) TaxID=1344416 RepID=A0A139ABQ2_GONPJ|nr:hypothetical protein M427DRAFT_156016 [Gonapodya prolifera JEL478]|eukprot:KXS14221.1 hypothetical protein M427DRAFT_156016 [Gonapodya prolifera JEL478]
MTRLPALLTPPITQDLLADLLTLKSASRIPRPLTDRAWNVLSVWLEQEAQSMIEKKKNAAGPSRSCSVKDHRRG